MKQTVTKSDFHDAFQSLRPENFSYEGREALFEYLEQLEQDLGKEIDFDVVALCCDYTEEKLSNVLKEYDLDSLDDLRDNTIVIMVDSDETEDPTIIYQAF